MKQMRYIITRPCLQEGSLRLLKYLEPVFPESGPVTLVDDRGREHAGEVDRAAGRVRGLRPLYHDGNLGVNDVLLLTPLEPGRYQVEAIVKPHAPPATPARSERLPEARRVVVTATPHVREVRLEQARPASGPASPETPSVRENRTTDLRLEPQPETPRPAPLVPLPAEPHAGDRPAARAAAPLPGDPEAQLAELARLTGYRLSFPAPGLARLAAELGEHSYVVKLALEPGAARVPGWREGADYAAVLTAEAERPLGTPRLTREALMALLEHARLAPLSVVELRGYWKAGNLDLDTAASISELVGAHLAQRGAFSFVLLTLATLPAHSLISPARLAERLGSGVNTAELHSILDTLTRAPFLMLIPLQGGQYLLRGEVRELLADLADYADGMRRRVQQPAGVQRAAVPF